MCANHSPDILIRLSDLKFQLKPQNTTAAFFKGTDEIILQLNHDNGIGFRFDFR